MVLPPAQHVVSLALQARERFVVQVGRALPACVRACDERLSALLNQAGAAQDFQLRRDAWSAFQQHQGAWLHQSRKALQRTLLPRPSHSEGPPREPDRLELVAEGVMDDQIMAARLAAGVLDRAATELNELRLRVLYLERRRELPRDDVLLPDVTARILVDQWLAVQMSREAWALVQEALTQVVASSMLEAYRSVNAFLVASGVMKEIPLQNLVRRSPAGHGAAPGGPSRPAADVSASGHMPPTGDVGAPGARWSGAADAGAGRGTSAGHAGPASAPAGVQDETRVMTAVTPLARARQQAQGVVARLKRLLLDSVGSDFEATQLLAPAPRLEQAIQRSMAALGQGDDLALSGGAGQGQIGASHVERVARALRERTAEIKQAAATDIEKATVEVVALMFQCILAEERIPPSVRIWFARLQMPVLRVALAEPDFFSSLQHPARRLIDRMGSCVLGFESNVGSTALEAEIKRVVQVIEQYPETGSRVFQLVLDEFGKFLATYLSERSSASRFVPVAQQVEQKETLSVQYTIELRRLLDDMPVRDEVRDFLFKVWVDVLAVASIKLGVRHASTAALKQVASDLLWAASAKPNRPDRARVMQQLPSLLQRLRQGMGMLGYPTGVQDRHIKSLNDTLADAFMSRTEAIPQERLDRLSERLAQLEDYLPQSGMGDLDLDNESIEMITGVDAANIEVINRGGTQPDDAMRAWALELQIGAWFGLDHNGRHINVQLAWRSDRGQLYLFVTGSGRCYLVQANRVAAYLQARLLVPSEEETLTVRATREALAKLDANPERLLA